MSKSRVCTQELSPRNLLSWKHGPKSDLKGASCTPTALLDVSKMASFGNTCPRTSALCQQAYRMARAPASCSPWLLGFGGLMLHKPVQEVPRRDEVLQRAESVSRGRGGSTCHNGVGFQALFFFFFQTLSFKSCTVWCPLCKCVALCDAHVCVQSLEGWGYRRSRGSQ